MRSAEKSDRVSAGSRHFVEQVLWQYGLGSVRFDVLKKGSNRLLRLTSATGNYILRVYNEPAMASTDLFARRNRELRSDIAIRSQLAWMVSLRETIRLPVQEPLTTLDGSLTLRVRSVGVPGPRICTLLRWIPGEHKRDALVAEDAYRIGRSVARMHHHSQDYLAPHWFDRPRWDSNHLFGESAPISNLAEKLLPEEDVDTLREAAKIIETETGKLGEPPSSFGIIHRDLQPNNLLFHNGVMYVIDFDHCGWGYYLYDLATPFIRLGEEYRDRGARMQDALLEGYSSVRSLSEADMRSLRVFVLMRLISRVDASLGRVRDLSRDELLSYERSNPSTFSDVMKQVRIRLREAGS